MKFLALGTVVAVVLGLCIATAFAATTDATKTATVTIENYAFNAPTLSVVAGTTVVWKNLDDDPHTVTAVDGSFDSHGLAQGDTYSYLFSKPGKYQYYCKVHPMMRGTIIVTERTS